MYLTAAHRVRMGHGSGWPYPSEPRERAGLIAITNDEGNRLLRIVRRSSGTVVRMMDDGHQLDEPDRGPICGKPVCHAGGGSLDEAGYSARGALLPGDVLGWVRRR